MNWRIACCIVLFIILLLVKCEKAGKRMGLIICIIAVIDYIVAQHENLQYVSLVGYWSYMLLTVVCLGYITYQSKGSVLRRCILGFESVLVLAWFIVRNVMIDNYYLRVCEYIGLRRRLTMLDSIHFVVHTINIIDITMIAVVILTLCLRNEENRK